MGKATKLAIAAVAGGLVLNVAAAWAAVIFSPVEPTSGGPVPKHGQAVWRRTAPADFPERAGMLVDKRFVGFRARVFRGHTDPGCELRIYEVGFPLASLRGIKAEVTWSDGRAEFRESIDPALVPVVPDVRVLPLRPIWPGFLVDTIFFTTVLALVVGSAHQGRRGLRRVRNRCPRCGYQARGSVCSECGELLEHAPPGTPVRAGG